MNMHLEKIANLKKMRAQWRKIALQNYFDSSVENIWEAIDGEDFIELETLEEQKQP